MRILRSGTYSVICVAGLAAALTGCAFASAAEVERLQYGLPAQALALSLRDLALQSGRSVVAPSTLVAGRQAPPLSGLYTVEEALSQLLAGSGLQAVAVGRSLVIKDAPATPTVAASGTTAGDDITVTGSRIRGAPIASTVITLGREDLRDAGQNTLGDVVRHIPQSFGGGQNPEIALNVPAASGINVGGGASINLRGLGSDATLTLLNGHRLAYSASRQSVDVSAIPFGALERIEIVPDGASALYGSDAVAGVANIILRRDFSGLETSARLAGATDGGDFQQQYGAVAGTTWGTGGVIGAYEFGRNTPIVARQRDFARTSDATLTFLPGQYHHSAVLAGHQSLTPTLEFAFDSLLNWRSTTNRYPLSAAARTVAETGARSFSLAPSLALDLGRGDWHATLAGTYGHDRVHFRNDTITSGQLSGTSPGTYVNSERSVEAGLEGRLLELPGGAVKAAFGGGYRSNHFESFRGTGRADNIARTQDSYFAYGELNVPLVAPTQDVPLVERLDLNAAVRYERYPGVGSVATPKLGVIYAPTGDFEVKGSWGKAFRAPTFFQKYQLQSSYLLRAASLGGTGLPSSATILLLAGGNDELKPERATTWSAGLVAHPRAVPGLRLEASYFNIRYRDRIVAPITFLAQALSNPIYRDLVQFAPTPTVQADAIANAGEFINATGAAYVPSNVVALVGNTNLNAGRQSLHGVDLVGSYEIELAHGGTVSVGVDASYLVSRQQLSAGQPSFPLAGVVFNPPHWRTRSTFSWSNGALTLTGALDTVGSVRDTRFVPVARIHGVTTLDLTARYHFVDGPAVLRNLDVIASVQNLFDGDPDHIRTSLPYDAPYDSTNYSAVGRVVSLGILKKW